MFLCMERRKLDLLDTLKGLGLLTTYIVHVWKHVSGHGLAMNRYLRQYDT